MEGAFPTLVHQNSSFHRVSLSGRLAHFSALLKQPVNLYFQPLDLVFFNPSVLVTKKDHISGENIAFAAGDRMTVPPPPPVSLLRQNDHFTLWTSGFAM